MAESPITPRARTLPPGIRTSFSQGDMAEPAEIVKGCMVIKANGYAVWEVLQRELDTRFKATGHQNIYFPLLIPQSFPAKGSRARGRLLAGTGGGHHRGRQELEEPYVIRPDVGNHHRPLLRQMDSELARSAPAVEPVGQRGPLGTAHAHVPAHHGIPLAGRPHRAFDPRRGAGRSAAHARCLRRRGRKRHGDAGDQGREDASREIRRAPCAAIPSKP